MSELPVVILGAGGHARVVIDVLLLRGVRVACLADRNAALAGSAVRGVRVVAEDGFTAQHGPKAVRLANGVASTQTTAARRDLYLRYKQQGYAFATLVHPSAVVAGDVVLGDGVQVMAGAVVQPGVALGENALVNTRASVDHDCRIAEHAHIAPGAVLCGAVRVGAGAHVGAGALVIQNVSIGAGALIAAGSSTTAAGCSAR
jgi:UDP-perosamine 4-acetyltransferase